MEDFVVWDSRNEDVFGMSKVSKKYANKQITGDFGEAVYFSPAQHSAGARIKFYAGGVSKNTNDYPYIPYTKDEIGEPVGDVKENPWLKDNDFIERVKDFIVRLRPFLLLVWYGYLDESDLLAYCNGNIKFENLIKDINFPSDCKVDYDSIKSVQDIDKYCRNNNLYNFENRR